MALQDDGTTFTWIKGDDESLSPHFRTIEFSCHCELPTCVQQKLTKDFFNRLEKMRCIANCRFIIDSGFRCDAYQQQLEDEKVNTVVAQHSQHSLGDAADVKCPSLTVPQLKVIAVQAGFNAFGIATNFLHVDGRPPHPDGTPLLWKY